MDAVLERRPSQAGRRQGTGVAGRSGLANGRPILKRTAGHQFYNISPLTFTGPAGRRQEHRGQPARLHQRLSPERVCEVMEAYDVDDKIERLDRAGILYAVLADFADLDLRPATVVSNEAMGYIFEELLRKFSEMSNETAGEHYTPREVIRPHGRPALLRPDSPSSPTTPRSAPSTTRQPGTGGMLMTALQATSSKLNLGARSSRSTARSSTTRPGLSPSPT
jgi:type I restriction enzyme M protein